MRAQRRATSVFLKKLYLMNRVQWSQTMISKTMTRQMWRHRRRFPVLQRESQSHQPVTHLWTYHGRLRWLQRFVLITTLSQCGARVTHVILFMNSSSLLFQMDPCQITTMWPPWPVIRPVSPSPTWLPAPATRPWSSPSPGTTTPETRDTSQQSPCPLTQVTRFYSVGLNSHRALRCRLPQKYPS